MLTVAHTHHIGLMAQPGTGYARQLLDWPYWAADNACYSQGERFNLGAYLRWLDSLPRSGCLFAVAPDVFGDAEATLRRSLPVLPQIRALGFKAAYVAQNDIQDAPWQAFDVLFIGGDNAFKYAASTQGLIVRARRHGKPVHMGRVNTMSRLRYSRAIGCDSADGTYLKFGPDVNLPRLVGWLRWLKTNPEMRLW